MTQRLKHHAGRIFDRLKLVAVVLFLAGFAIFLVKILPAIKERAH